MLSNLFCYALEGGATTITLSSILTDVGSIVTNAISWLGDFATFIVGSPLLMLFCLVPLVGLGIGLLKRMMSL